MRKALLVILGLAACGGDDGGQVVVDAAPAADVFGGGDPIEAPAETWTWVPFEEARCMNDTPTGIGVNLVPDAPGVVIYLEGGGACYNAFTCAGVAHQDGFDENTLDSFVGDYGSRGIFNRADTDNPFAGWSFVFVPYCTGDIHAGAAPDGFEGRMQVGYLNMGHYLERLVPTFQQVDTVVLTGSSAGGYGASFNYDRVQKAFGGVPVHLLNDSGPTLSDDYLGACLQEQLRELWNLNETLPADCTECFNADGGGLSNAATFIAEKYPDRRFGLISSLEDGTIRLFYGYGYPSCTNPQIPMPAAPFTEGLNQLADEILAPYDNAKVYYITGGIHVWLLDNPVGGLVVDGVSLTDWIRALISGNGFENVRP